MGLNPNRYVREIRGRRVMDIASHDGRWSLPAKRAGAEYVLGIEARQHLVEAARRNMREYGVIGVEFTHGDVMLELDRLEPRKFDTVFCFGFLYRTSEHNGHASRRSTRDARDFGTYTY